MPESVRFTTIFWLWCGSSMYFWMFVLILNFDALGLGTPTGAVDCTNVSGYYSVGSYISWLLTVLSFSLGRITSENPPALHPLKIIFDPELITSVAYPLIAYGDFFRHLFNRSYDAQTQAALLTVFTGRYLLTITFLASNYPPHSGANRFIFLSSAIFPQLLMSSLQSYKSSILFFISALTSGLLAEQHQLAHLRTPVWVVSITTFVLGQLIRSCNCWRYHLSASCSMEKVADKAAPCMVY